VTGLVELVRIDDKTSAHISKKFSETGYPGIHGRRDMYMIMEESLLDINSNVY